MQTSAGHRIYQPPILLGRPTRRVLGSGSGADRLGPRAERIFDPVRAIWPPDARLNTCHNAVDRHVAAGRGAQPAIIWDSPMTGRIETLTYAALLGRVSKLAGALAARGVGAGDRVVIYMPMVTEAAIGMLACAGSARCIPWSSAASPRPSSRRASPMPNPR